MSCPRRSQKLIKYGGKLLDSGYPRTKNCTNAPFLGHTCSAYILRHQNYSLKSYIKGFVEATLEADLYLTKQSLKATDGQICKKKVQKYVKKYDQCQRYAPNIHQPGRVLNPLSSSWLFAQWGLDIVGPFPKAAGNKRYLLVGTDYFTKWVEAEPLANIKDVDAKKFVWKNIVTRFGVPCTLISDNGLKFDSKSFRRYCCNLGITNKYSTSAYLQGNGQVETGNKVIVSGLKKMLDDVKGK